MYGTRKGKGLYAIIFAMLLLPFFSINGIRNALGNVYQLWQIVSVFTLFLFVLNAAKEIKLNWAVTLFFLYQMVVLVSTFLNHGISYGILTVGVAAVALFLLLQTHYYCDIVTAMSVMVTLVAVINLPTMLSQTANTNTAYFIGGKNYLSIFLIPGAFLSVINDLNSSQKIRKKTYIVIGLCVISVLIGSSGTGIVVAICAIALMLVTIKYKPKKHIYIFAILVCYAILLLFFEKVVTSSYWLSFTERLGKDGTLTSRAYIWSSVEEIIRENWLFGAGRGTEFQYINTLGVLVISYETHNLLLQILLEGGLVALVLYSVLCAKMIKHLDIKDSKGSVIFIAFCTILINGLTEATINNFFVTIVLGIACRYAEENRRKKKINEQQT